MNALPHCRSELLAGAPADADLDDQRDAAAGISPVPDSGVPAEFGLLVLDNWRPPQTVEEAHALLANAKTLRALGEQTTRASWVDLANAQETAVGMFLCFRTRRRQRSGRGAS
jgi:hypothetical protein